MAAHRKSDRYRNDLIAAISAFLSGESRTPKSPISETSFRRLRRRRWTITVLLGLRNCLPPHARDSDPFRALLGWANLKPSILFFCFINVVDAHGYGKRFIVRADEMLTAFVELQRAIHEFAVDLIS